MSRDETPTAPSLPADQDVRVRRPHCGNRIQLVSGDQRELVGTPERIFVWAEVLTEMELDDSGTVRPLTESAIAERKKRLDELGGSPLPKP